MADSLFDKLPYADGSGRRRVVTGGLVLLTVLWINADILTILPTDLASPTIIAAAVFVAYTLGILVELLGDALARIVGYALHWRHQRKEFHFSIEDLSDQSLELVDSPLIRDGLSYPTGRHSELAFQHLISRFKDGDNRTWARRQFSKTKDVLSVPTVIIVLCLVWFVSSELNQLAPPAQQTISDAVRSARDTLVARMTSVDERLDSLQRALAGVSNAARTSSRPPSDLFRDGVELSAQEVLTVLGYDPVPDSPVIALRGAFAQHSGYIDLWALDPDLRDSISSAWNLTTSPRREDVTVDDLEAVAERFDAHAIAIASAANDMRAGTRRLRHAAVFDAYVVVRDGVPVPIDLGVPADTLSGSVADVASDFQNAVVTDRRTRPIMISIGLAFVLGLTVWLYSAYFASRDHSVRSIAEALALEANPPGSS